MKNTDHTKKVSVGSRIGTILNYVIKGPMDTYGIVKFDDGNTEEIFHKNINYIQEKKSKKGLKL